MSGSRLSRLVLAGALACLWAVPAGAAERPLVELDAAGLAQGSLKNWPNTGSAGGAFEAGTAGITVAQVDGRQAAVFHDKHWMRSTFVVPGGLTKGRPFTLAMWARPEKLVGKQVMLTWASRPYDCAEFGYGKSREGAFCGWLRDCGYRRPPDPLRWRHFAYTFADGELRIYVDGRLDDRHELKLTPKAGEPMVLGAAWDSVKKSPCFGFRGGIARVRVWDRCLSHREVRNDMGAVEPFDPQPADGSMVDDRRASLRWENGHPRAVTVRLYLSDDRSAIESLAASARRGAEMPAGESGRAGAGELTLGKTYFWRIEQLDQAGKTLDKGPLWSFTLSAGPAAGPRPRHRVAGIPQSTRELRWTPGRYVVSQTVYFGPDEKAVAAGEAVLAGRLPASAGSTPLKTALEYGKTYYWRVDQDNGPLPPAAGGVWAFRVEDKPEPDKLTFFVVGDTHYGLTWRAEPAGQALIDMINFLPGAPLPEKAGGGIVRTPCGVIHLGDMTNDGREDQWRAWVRDFGLTGEGRLAFPVLEMFGNHDGGVENPVRKGILERNRRRQGFGNGEMAISDSGMHTAWQWQGIRLVNLGISVGTTTRPYDPQDSIGFLKQELARVKDKSQPIILLHHFGFDKRHSLRWWSDAWRDAYYDAIKDYNVLGIFHGHDHETEIYRWKGLDIFDAPHIRDADNMDKPVRHGLFVVQVEDGQMLVAERKTDGTWGMFKRKAISKQGHSR